MPRDRRSTSEIVPRCPRRHQAACSCLPTATRSPIESAVVECGAGSAVAEGSVVPSSAYWRFPHRNLDNQHEVYPESPWRGAHCRTAERHRRPNVGCFSGQAPAAPGLRTYGSDSSTGRDSSSTASAVSTFSATLLGSITTGSLLPLAPALVGSTISMTMSSLYRKAYSVTSRH